MDLNGKITSGCTVHLPKAEEGDFVLHIPQKEGYKLSQIITSTKRGRIDFISREKLRQAVVHWEPAAKIKVEDPWHKYFAHVIFFCVLALMAAAERMEARGVAYCDEAIASKKARKSGLLMALALMVPILALFCSKNMCSGQRRNKTL